MLQTILVPLDGSRFAEGALPLAKRLAGVANGRLRLVMVHHVIPAWNPAIGFPDGGATLEQDTRAREEKYLAAQVRAAATETGRPVSSALLEGTPGEAIVREARESGAGLIVMATHGRGPASRFWLGSTTDYVLRHVEIPLLTIRPSEEPGAAVRGGAAIKRILVPMDGSTLSESVVGPASELARLVGAELLLVAVVEPAIGMMDPAMPFPAAMDPNAMESQRTEVLRRLDKLAEGLRGKGITVKTQVVVAIGIAASILDLVEREHADLVAMSTHGAGGLRRALLGSVTDKVIRGSQRPVLAWRPPVS